MKSPHKTPNKLLWIIGIIIVAIACYLLYSQWLHMADRQKFMTIKSDILALQKEFNQIDPGWEYSEACHAKGEKFKRNEASSCWVVLSQENVTAGADAYYSKKYEHFSIIKDSSYRDEGGVFYDNRVYKYRNSATVICEFGFTKSSPQHPTGKGALSCRDSALDFYFPKNQ